VIRPGSFSGKLLAGGVGKVVCLCDAHFLLLALASERGKV
jgi:hypothetical protein